MDIEKLFDQLKELEVSLWMEGDSLKYKAPKGVVDNALLGNLRLYKKELQQYLSTRDEMPRGQEINLSVKDKQVQLPLSFSQQRLYFLSQLAMSANALHIYGAVRLKGALNIVCLEQSLNVLCQRHDALRLSFGKDDHGNPFQCMHPNSRIKIDRIGAHGKSLDALVTSIVNQPFDLASAPLMRIALAEFEGEHLLIVVVHHLVADAWSLGILINDLTTVYADLQEERPVTLPPLRRSYLDHILWQRSHADTPHMRDQLGYWMKTLAGLTESVPFPSDYNRPEIQRFEGDAINFHIDSELAGQLKALCANTRTSMYMVLLTAYVILLSRYVGEDDIAVGSPFANRNQPDLEDLVGNFVNLLVLRVDMSGSPSFVELLRKVKKLCLEAQANQDVPFEKLVEELAPTRRLSHSPLVQAAFVFQNAPSGVLHLPGLDVEPIEILHVAAQYELNLTVESGASDFYGFLEYNVDLFHPSTIEAMVNAYLNVLREIVSDPFRGITNIELLSEAERSRVIDQCNKGISSRPVINETLVTLFEEQVKQRPTQRALVYKGWQLTYFQVNEMANRLSHYLYHDLHIRRGDRVAVFLEPSEFLVPTLLGVMKASAVYVPIDVSFPSERIQAIVNDTEAKLLITQSDLLDRIGAIATPLFAVDVQLELLQTSGENLCVDLAPDDSVYIVYTSGSTGKPKGVVVPHRGVTRLVKDTNYVTLSANSTVLSLSNFAFDGFAFDLFASCTNGATLVLTSKDDITNTDRVRQLIDGHDNVVFFITTALFNSWVDVDISVMRNASAIYFGGNEASLPHVRRFREHYPHKSLANIYGPTENTVFSTCYFVDNLAENLKTLPIGTPVSGTNCFVLDAYGNVQPTGALGELCVSGIGLASGYFRDTELTDKKFVTHPLIPQGKVYRTGDVVRWRYDGNLEFIGRIDTQVKIRGFRIELGEIQAVLTAMQPVLDAVVVVSEIEGEKQIIAYYKAEKELDVWVMSGFLKQRLPEFMIPSHFVWLTEFPLNSNGKLDIKRLPLPVTADETEAIEQPRDHVEEQLLSTWKEELKTKNLGIHQNFFANGGDSIKAIRIISQINKVFGIDIGVKEIFLFQTVAELAGHIRSLKPVTSLGRQVKLSESAAAIEAVKLATLANGELGIPLDVIEDIYPVADVQLGMIYYGMLYQDSAVFHDQIPTTFSVRDLDVELLRQAYYLLVAKHTIFRTSFHIKGLDTPVQIVHKIQNIESPFVFEEIDHIDGNEQLSCLEQYLEDDRKSPFDLEKPGLWRVKVFKLSSDRFVMVRSFHHCILDGWSDASFVTELSDTYQKLKKDRHYAPATLRATYKDYIIEQHYHKNCNDWKQFWKETLKGITRSDLPFNKTVALQKGQLDKLSHTFKLPERFEDGVHNLAIRFGTGAKQVFLSAVTMLLRLTTNSTDTTFGVMSNARPEIEDGDKVLGCFISNGILNFKAPMSASIGTVIQDVAKTYDKIKQFDKISLNSILEVVGENATNKNPFFDVYFSYLDFHIYEQLGSVPLQGDLQFEGYANANTYFDIVVVNEVNGFRVSLIGIANAYTGDELNRMEKYFLNILDYMIDGDNRQPMNWEKIIGEEGARKPVRIAGELQSQASNYTLIHRINSIADQHPDALAIIDKKKRNTTYGELKSKWITIAGVLVRDFGVRKGDIVGIMLDNSEAAIVTMLALHHLGAAFLPIDTAYPDDRKAYIISDSNILTLIADPKQSMSILNFKGKVLWFTDDLFSRPDQVGFDGQAEPASLAYVIYTSGSTGFPKGAMIDHAAIVNTIDGLVERLNVTGADNVLQFASLSFDASIYEIFLALFAGARITLVERNRIVDQEYFIDHLQRHKVNVVLLPPSFLNTLPLQRLDFLRVITTGGEAPIISDAVECAKFAEYYNSYGPTECAVCVSTYHVPSDHRVTSPLPIGKPNPNIWMYILNEDCEPVAPGVTGEIYIQGRGVGRGYLNRVELTTEKFVRICDGNIIYKTGDLGRLLPSGDIEFVGRNDRQVKIRGYRVELGEIETTIRKYDTVNEVVVLCVQDESSRQRLLAFFTASAEIIVSDLRNHLALTLPNYMLPHVLQQIERFPLNSSGKIDKAALEKYESVADDVFESQGNELYEKLAAVWARVLGVIPISVKDNFFTSGGDSIRVISLVAGINESLALDLHIADVLDHPTFETLAAFIVSDKWRSRGLDQAKGLKRAFEEIESIKRDIIARCPAESLPVEFEDIYPLSAIQEGMIYYNLLNRDNAIYHDQTVYQFEDEAFDFKVLTNAFARLAEKYEILRTSFYLTEFGTPVQVVRKPGALRPNVELIDISNLAELEQSNYLKRFLNEDRLDGFDIVNGALWRIRVFKLTERVYALVWIFHHAVIDGWSDSSLLTELTNVYFTLKKNGEYKPEKLRAGMKDYVADQIRWNRDEAAIAFWKNKLSGYQRTPLPFNRSGKKLSLSESSQLTADLLLDISLSDRIDKIANLRQVHVSQIFLAAFAYLVRFTTGALDILFGLVTSGRPTVPDSEKLIGCFLNTVPLRFDLRVPTTNFSVLSIIEDGLREVKPFDKLSLHEISKYFQDDAPGESPLFDMQFNYTDFHVLNSINPGISTQKPIIESYGRNNILMEINIAPSEHGYYVALDSISQLYSKAELQRLIAYFRNILELLSADDETFLSHEKLLHHDELKLMGLLSPPSTTPRVHAGAIALLEEQVRMNADRTAVIYKDLSLTYQKLNELSNRVANWLIKDQKLCRGDIVGVFVSRTEMVPAILLGILKAGFAYLPLDPAYPGDRISFCIEDCNSGIIITDSTCSHMLQTSVNTVRVENIFSESINVVNPAIPHSQDQIAYIIYTSGSTGKPKGVAIDHKNLNHFIDWARGEYDENVFDIVFFGTSYCFDLSVYELFYTFSIGKHIRVLESALEFGKHLRTERRILINTVPSVIDDLTRQEADLSNVVAINMAGETLPEKVLRRLDASRILVRNLYGPSEDTTYSTCHLFADNNEDISIGKAISDKTVLILDEALQLVPPGVNGEVYICGNGITQGYLNRVELTHEKFITNGFTQGSRLYKTGDICRWGDNGQIYFVGRRDHQIKLRGFRIELGDIEGALLRNPLVEKAAAFLFQSDVDPLLVGLYESKNGLPITDLDTYLKKKLPHYMVPSHLGWIEAIPLNSNGKTDRKKLEREFAERQTVSASSINDQNHFLTEDPLEKKLLQIWCEVLGSNNIGVKDHFIDVGGHSLKATQLMLRLNRSLDLDLEIKDIFMNPTIESLAEFIRTFEGTEAEKITPVEEQDHYALSHAQKRLWVLNQFEEERKAYTVPLIYELKQIDTVLLEKAIDAVIQRHETLRTSFRMVGNEVRQRVNTTDRFKFNVINIEYLTEYDQQRQYLNELIQSEVEKEFDLSISSPLRNKLVVTGVDESVLVLCLHHILADGWSVRVLLDEINLRYEALTGLRDLSFSPLHIQYKDFVAWEAKRLSAKKDEQYWFNKLSDGFGVVDFAFDKLPGESNDFSGASETIMVAPELLTSLKTLARESGVTVSTTIFSLFNLLLSKLTGQKEITVAMAAANRNGLEIESLIGFFVNMVLIRTDLSKVVVLKDLISQVNSNIQEALVHQSYPVDLLVEKLNPLRQSNYQPLFNVTYVFQNQSDVVVDIGGSGSQSFNREEGSLGQSKFRALEHTTAKFDLQLFVQEVEGQLSLTFEYNCHLFSSTTLQKYLQHFRTFIEKSVEA